MKTKKIVLIFALLSVALFSVCLSACGKEDKITFKTLTLNGNTAYGKVSNDTETFSFLQEITVHGNASYQVYKEITCETLFKSKTIDLKEGDNTVYVLQTVGEELTLYTVTVRRRPMYTISFDTSGLFDIDDLIVEEDSIIQEPTIDIDERLRGYNFNGWNFDFSKPVIENAVITGITIKPEMKNFVFTSTAETCVITDIIDESVTQILVPDYVTEIADGAFSGCGNLEEITIPFVGAVAGKTSNDTYQYPFGYIFGTDSYSGGTEVKQNYYGSSTSSTTYTTYYIPSSLRRVTLTGGNILLGAFSSCSNLTSVTIPDSVMSIGSSAFYGCSSLTSVTIPDSVTSIGFYAFGDCSSLTEINYNATECADLREAVFYNAGLNSTGITVTIGAKVKKIPNYLFYTSYDYKPQIISVVFEEGSICESIGVSAFYNCSNLTSVYITDIAAWCKISFGDYYANPLDYAHNLYLNNELVTELVIPDGVTSIGNYAFRYCSSLTSVTIPDSVTSIVNYAFSNCSSLTSVTIGNSVTSIGDEAFSGCSRLTSVTIGNSVTSIGNYAFYNCSSLTSVTIPNIVTSIGYEAFRGCSSLTGVTIPDSVTSISDRAFYSCSSLTSVTIPDSVTSIGSSAFYGCSSLTSVTIPDSVTSIGDEAFYGCSSLTSVTIPNSVTSIGSSAFENCRSLTSVTIPDSVTSIGDGAFSGCSSLSNITIPDSVTSIGDYAFRGCRSLTSVTIPDSVTSIGDGAFSGCSSLSNITIPDNVTSIGDYAFYYCSSLTNISVNENNQTYKSIDGNLYTKDGTVLVQYAIGKTATSFVIPDSVKSIGDGAFSGCSSLTSITIPNSVKSIGYGAFSSCYNLTSVTFENTNGWYICSSSSATSVTNIDVTNTARNATYLTSTYIYYYWKRG